MKQTYQQKQEVFMKSYTLDDLARMIDHTNLHTDASPKDMEVLCNEAKEHHFAMVAINQVQSGLCAKLLEGTDIHTGAAISFPLGQTTIASKVFDTKDAIANGANEIDYVVNQTEIKASNWDYLNDEEKIKLCEIAKEVKPDFIKTSTGFGTGGATFDDVKLMKEHVGDAVKVKAAGGIRDAKTFMEMIECGAQRIGTSAGISIIKEFEAMMKEQGVSTLEI